MCVIADCWLWSFYAVQEHLASEAHLLSFDIWRPCSSQSGLDAKSSLGNGANTANGKQAHYAWRMQTANLCRVCLWSRHIHHISPKILCCDCGSEWEYDTLRRRETWDFAQLTLHLYIINWRNVKQITLILAAIFYRGCLLFVWNCWWPTLLYSLWVKYRSLYFKQTTWKFQLHALLDARLDVNNREAPTWQSKVRIIYLPLHLSQQ